MPKGRKSTVKKYERAGKTYLGNIRSAENQGAIYDRSTIPYIPEKVTMQDVKEIRELNKKENRYKNELWVSRDTGETITGTEYRALSNRAKKEYQVPPQDEDSANYTYIDAVQELVDNAVSWIENGQNINSLTPADASDLEVAWATTLSYLESDEDVEQLNAYLKMNQEQIATSLDVIMYESERKGDSSEIEMHYEMALDLLSWEPPL